MNIKHLHSLRIHSEVRQKQKQKKNTYEKKRDLIREGNKEHSSVFISVGVCKNIHSQKEKERHRPIESEK